jgi:N-acetylmuramoyl-L-alanine amidase
MKTIALSAGHSDKDPGAVYNGLVERDLVEKIVAYATPIIKAHGVGVLNPPSSLNLTETIKWINDRSAQIDICTEIHINSSAKANTGFGLEGWYYRGSNESKEFASFLLDALAAESGMSKTRGVKDERYANIWGRLGFVHDTKPLACLMECGFINTEADRKVLSTETGLYNLAKGIARGVVSYLGIPWVAPKPEDNQQGEEVLKLREDLAKKEVECQGLKDRLLQISRISAL